MVSQKGKLEAEEENRVLEVVKCPEEVEDVVARMTSIALLRVDDCVVCALDSESSAKRICQYEQASKVLEGEKRDSRK